MSNILAILLKLLPFIPTIATTVHNTLPGGSLETKQQLAQDYLNLATGVATAVLPGEESTDAQAAGQIAQVILGTTVAAIHGASTPVQP